MFYLKYWSIAPCLFLPGASNATFTGCNPVSYTFHVLCRFLASSSLFLRSYVTFSAILFLDFTAFRWIHPARSFSTIASTPLRHFSLFAAVLRKMSRCLPFSRSSILKCIIVVVVVVDSIREQEERKINVLGEASPTDTNGLYYSVSWRMLMTIQLRERIVTLALLILSTSSKPEPETSTTAGTVSVSYVALKT